MFCGQGAGSRMAFVDRKLERCCHLLYLIEGEWVGNFDKYYWLQYGFFVNAEAIVSHICHSLDHGISHGMVGVFFKLISYFSPKEVKKHTHSRLNYLRDRLSLTCVLIL